MMNQKLLLKKVCEKEMPDISETRRMCIDKLRETQPDKKRKRTCVAAVICVGILAICLTLTPLNSFAKNFFVQVEAILNLNGSKIAIGDSQKSTIKIPKDCERVEYEGETYLTKAYQNLDLLENEVGMTFDTWNGNAGFQEDGVLLNIVENSQKYDRK